ncbi:reverse transcriptase domain-containing protein [Tanacetum coccineum]
MRELREDTFFGNKNDDAHEHVDRLSLGTVDSWDLLKKVFIQRYCPPSKTAKQLKEIFNFKQEGDETLYQAWERYNELLYKCPTYDINSHQRVNIFYNGLGSMNRQLLDSQGPIPGRTPDQALTAIQTMADHSQKWNDGSSSRNIDSSSNSERIAAIVSKLDSIGAHLDKECPLNEEVKSIEEVKYGEFDRPFRNNSRNDGKFNRVSGYDQPSAGERRLSLTKIINKYMEETAKRHAEQDEWLKKFYQNTKTNQEARDKIIQGLETKVRTLTNEVEGRTNGGKFEKCKAIFTEDGSPLYTPFYYSPKENEYFSASSGFSEIKQVPKGEKQSISYYVEPYEPPIPFPRRLEHHAEEALVHKTMESLKKIKINRPLLKEIRQTVNYVKHMKDLVENKPRTEEDEEIRINPRCSALLQNQLPPKEQDPRSFILPCSIGRLDFNNALADLRASINVMPLSMYKRLCMGKLKPINMVIEMADNTKCTPKGILETYSYGKVCKITRERILKDHWRERFEDEEDDIKENSEDPEECREDKANVIMGAILDNLNDDWFNGTSEDEDNLEGILDYLEPRSYDGFIDLDNEAYNKRKCRLLGLTYKEPPPILTEKVKVTRYTIGLEEIYTKVKVLGIDEMPRTRDNNAAIRARLMEKMSKDGSVQAKTFSQQQNEIRGDMILHRMQGSSDDLLPLLSED